MNAQQKRKGLARIVRIVPHKEMLVVEVINDPQGGDEFINVEALCFLNKSKQLWMLDCLDEGDEIGVELPLKPGRGIDPVTWALGTLDQPQDLQAKKPNGLPKQTPLQRLYESIEEPSQSLDSVESVENSAECKKICGKLKDPLTQSAFRKFMSDRNVNQTDAVEITIRHGLVKLGYEA
jgi:hypothetical protein